MEEKIIGGIPLSEWRKAYAELCRIAADKDYFSDILFFTLYPNAHEEAAKEDDDEKLGVYWTIWEYAAEAFKEIFNENMHYQRDEDGKENL